MTWKGVIKRGDLQAALVLALILNAVFFPALWGGKTLLMSAYDAASITELGAYRRDTPSLHVSRTRDAGAPAWQSEPWLQIVSDQYWKEHNFPLWNPYSAYGTPLAADMQSQPFYPLTFLAAIHPTPWAYNLLVIGRLFVAGLLMFMFARLFVKFLPSLLAAVSFMLSGYFIIYMDMPHLSVEVLIPGVFLAFELLLRKDSWGATAGTAVMVLLSVTGGMPESLFLIVSFGCLYFLFRLFTTAEFRDHPMIRLAKFGTALALGFALSTFLLLPFVEFMRVGHDTHQIANLGGRARGLEFFRDGPAAATYLLPLIFGPVWNSIMTRLSGDTGLVGYWGIIPCIFAVAAVLCWFVPGTASESKPHRSLTMFFGATFTLMMLKRTGNPIINWIGGLPIANMVGYPKYLEPLMGFCVAMLAGIGFSLLVTGRARRAYFLVSALIVLGAMLGLAGWSLPSVLQLKANANVYYLNVLAGILVIVAAAVLLFRWDRFERWITVALVGLAALELSFNFIVPSFYLFNSLPSVQMNPYGGAPYVNFLKTRNQGHERVFARDNLLYPNWAGVFGLGDVRTLDAMVYRRYHTFIRSFLLKPGDEGRMVGDLADRFTGSEPGYPYAFDTATEQRFLALSSVRYLISRTNYGVSTKVMDEILAQHRFEKIWGFGAGVFPAGDYKSAAGLFQHPPSSRIAYKTKINPKQSLFEGIAAIGSEAQDKSDGVGFLLEIRNGGKTQTLFSTQLNPRDIAADRAGRPFQVDLMPYAGKTVELLFSTDPGPKGNNGYDWAGWAGLRFASREEPHELQPQFKIVYNSEVVIYENNRTLPRASLFRAAEVRPDESVLSRLKDPDFDPEQTVVLSAESLPKEAVVRALTDAPASPVAQARIITYESQRVEIEADTDEPAVLMLNDTNYPGWRATVNGNPAPILCADYLFRGVILPAGKNIVKFSYEPVSYGMGFLISASAAVVLAFPAMLALRRRRRRSRTVNPYPTNGGQERGED